MPDSRDGRLRPIRKLSTLYGSRQGALLRGLSAFYSLEEASGTRADATGNGLTLTDNNTVTQQTGKVGNCAQFTAANSEYLSVADNARLRGGTNRYTVAAWLYLDALPGGTDLCYAVSKVGGGVADYSLVVNAAGQLLWYNSGNTSSVTSATAIVATTWYFVVADYNQSLLRVSVNGGAFTTAAAGTPSAVTSGILSLGAHSTGTAATFWDGRIDQPGFWQRELSAAEIAFMYNVGSGKTYAQIAAYLLDQ